MNRHEEFHVTVAPSKTQTTFGLTRTRNLAFDWRRFCETLQIKPLWIELNTFETQLMCAAPTDPTELIIRAGYEILRFKHEVGVEPINVSTFQDLGPRFIPGTEPRALYYECHVKLDGPFRPDLPLASRDLYRQERWYMTHRSSAPFDGKAFVDAVMGNLRHTGDEITTLAGWEYEAAIEDTNSALDAKWIERAHRTYDLLSRASSRIVVPR